MVPEDVQGFYFQWNLFALYVFYFYSNYLYHPLLFGFFSRHLSSSPNIRYTFIYRLVRYSLSLIYKGIRLYARVTNLGLEGEQTLQDEQKAENWAQV